MQPVPLREGHICRFAWKIRSASLAFRIEPILYCGAVALCAAAALLGRFLPRLGPLAIRRAAHFLTFLSCCIFLRLAQFVGLPIVRRTAIVAVQYRLGVLPTILLSPWRFLPRLWAACHQRAALILVIDSLWTVTSEGGR